MPSPSPLRRDRVIDLLATQTRAMHVNEIATLLGIEAGAYAALHRVLDDLAFDGSVVAMTGQRFKLGKVQRVTHGQTVTGVLNVNPRGFAFVAAPGLGGDVYLPPEALGGALHGDTVVVRIAARSQRGVEGAVSQVLLRRSPRIAGTLRKRGKSMRFLSRHAIGLAIDVFAVGFVDGEVLQVKADWSRGARRLAAVAAVFEQADRFRTPLTPANDPHDHDDHLHLEAHMHLDAAR